MWWFWLLLVLALLGQGLAAVGLLGILISAFSDTYRAHLSSFVAVLFAGVILYLVVYWTLVVIVALPCPGGYC